MAKEIHLYEILRRPIITEKSTLLQGQSKYVFEVDREANKLRIKEAVELAFNVKVQAVNTLTIPPKVRMRGRRRGIRPGWKKAIVTLRQGEKIEFFEGV